MNSAPVFPSSSTALPTDQISAPRQYDDTFKRQSPPIRRAHSRANNKIHHHHGDHHHRRLPPPPASTSPTHFPPSHKFRSTTIAPSPPSAPDDLDNDNDDNIYPSIDDSSFLFSSSPSSSHPAGPALAPPHHGALGAHGPHGSHGPHANFLVATDNAIPLNHRLSANSLRLLTRTPSLHAALAGSIASVGSVSGASSGYPSPMIASMGDMTPLPSPLMAGDSPGPWKKLAQTSTENQTPTFSAFTSTSISNFNSNSNSISTSTCHSEHSHINSTKRSLYRPLVSEARPAQQPWHSRNRSISDYSETDAMSARQLAASSASRTKAGDEPQIRRERNFAESRGLAPSNPTNSTISPNPTNPSQPPTPPLSESSKDSTVTPTITKTNTTALTIPPMTPTTTTATATATATTTTAPYEYFEARGRYDNKLRRWRSIRNIGQGTFSRVVLATSLMGPSHVGDDTMPSSPWRLDRRSLVAVKICEHGPRGGASEERVEMSLKRELEIMQSVHHPSLVDLKAWSIEPTRAILVLSYCAGGDLFDVGTRHRKLLTPALTRRIFAEMVGAVRYLHQHMIVHRDIKLENVLVNLTVEELADPSIDWIAYPYSVTTLADLGLSRRISPDEKLETRCGSEDYAAPEVIMGQPYDGRATDAWSLGVLLYALLEARLPFDPHPGMSDSHRMRSRKSHRIARVDWRWFEYADEEGDGEHEGSEDKFRERGLEGAMRIAEGLLKRVRSRWTLDRVASEPWVSGMTTVNGGLRFREEIGGILI